MQATMTEAEGPASTDAPAAGLQAIHDRVARNRAKLEEAAAASKSVTFAAAVETQTIEARPEKPTKEKTQAKKKYLKRKLERRKAAKKSQVLGEPPIPPSQEGDDAAETPEERVARKKARKLAKQNSLAEQNGDNVPMEEAQEAPAVDPTLADQPPVAKKRKITTAVEPQPETAEDSQQPGAIKALEKATKAMKKSSKQRRPKEVMEPALVDNAIHLEALPRFARPAKPAGPDASLLATLNVAEQLRTGSRIPSTLTTKIEELSEQEQPLLSRRVLDKLTQEGISNFFAVQSAVIPLMLGEKAAWRRRNRMAQRDLCVNAPTGSGKTLAYVLPIVELLSKHSMRKLRALVILPTQDLALQIKETFDQFLHGTRLKVDLLTGNKRSDAHRDMHNDHEASPYDILVATPGRLIDSILDGVLPLQDLEFLVVDEADRLLNQDFNDWLPLLIDAIREIEECRRIAMVRQKYAATRSHITTQKLLFSATLSRDPVKIASLRLTKPLYVVVTDDTTAIADHEAAEFALPATLKESYMVLDSGIKPLQLAHLTATRDITNALCFTQSTQAAKRLVTLLSLIGEEVPELASTLRTHVFSSDMPLKERSRVLQEFKAGDIKLLVCSDLISRGIDIPHVQHVLNYDAPIDIRKYVHRVGRTARAGQEGSAWTLVEEQQASFFKTLMREAGRLDKLERIRVKEKDLEQLMPGYERALARLKDDYATRQ